MKRWLLLALLLIALPGSVAAQNTSVSGTITDLGGVVWKNGTYSFTWQPSPQNPTANYSQNGVPFNKSTTISGSLDGTGSLTSVAIPDNLTIIPSGSTYAVQVCPLATATNGCYKVQLTITGASQSITSSVVPPAIVVNMQNPPPGGVSAYTDVEISGARVGNNYFNLTDSTIHLCLFPACTWQSLAGTGTVSTTGSPVAGSLTKFSGATSITNGDLTGDVTTSGTTATTLASTIAGAKTWSNLATFSAGITGTGSIGTLTVPVGSLPTGIPIGNVGSAGLSATLPIRIAATGVIDCAGANQCVTSAAALTSTALMTGAGGQGSQTPSATTTLSAGGNLSLAGTLGATNGGTLGGTFAGSYTNSGTVTDTGIFICTITNATACISPSNPQGWAGSDIGAWINSINSTPAVCASINCNAIQIAPGAYNDATAASITRAICIQGGGSSVTTITWTPATGTAVSFSPVNTAGCWQGITLTTSTSTTSIGMQLNYVNEFLAFDFKIHGFFGGLRVTGDGSANFSSGVRLEQFLVDFGTCSASGYGLSFDHVNDLIVTGMRNYLTGGGGNCNLTNGAIFDRGVGGVLDFAGTIEGGLHSIVVQNTSLGGAYGGIPASIFPHALFADTPSGGAAILLDSTLSTTPVRFHCVGCWIAVSGQSSLGTITVGTAPGVDWEGGSDVEFSGGVCRANAAECMKLNSTGTGFSVHDMLVYDNNQNNAAGVPAFTVTANPVNWNVTDLGFCGNGIEAGGHSAYCVDYHLSTNGTGQAFGNNTKALGTAPYNFSGGTLQNFTASQIAVNDTFPALAGAIRLAEANGCIDTKNHAVSGNIQIICKDTADDIVQLGDTSGTKFAAAILGTQPQVSLGAVGTAGQLGLVGSTSGTATITAPAVAGTLTNAIVSSNAIQAGAAGTAGGVLGMGGSTSGVATLTAPAVAGTTTNPVVSSNALQAPFFQTATATPALSGIIRVASADSLGCFRNAAASADKCFVKSGAVSGGISADSLDITQFGMEKHPGRLIVVGTAPTCAFTSGGGTSPSCTVDTGSTDFVGVIKASEGTSPTVALGTITLTFSATYGTNKPACVYSLSNGGTGVWNARATAIDLTPTTTSDVFNIDNNGTTFSASSSYWINYVCGAK
jgi:hypothetical protein